MSATVRNAAPSGTADEPEPENYLTPDYGIRSWLLTTDHKRIALLYLIIHHLLFLPRRGGGDLHAAGADDAAGDLV